MSEEKRKETSEWFKELRDMICKSYEEIENNYAKIHDLKPAKFEQKNWQRDGGGGGVMSLMKGNVFEKVGVNISTVFGELSEEFSKQIPGAEKNRNFFATGISLVSHMKSPLAPAAHFNTRYIETSKSWFGGGGDLTPTYPDAIETNKFHNYFKNACDKFDTDYYTKFKKACDDYFFLPHRNEHRGVGGIFYDYLNSGSFQKDFEFTKEVGKAFRDSYPNILNEKINLQYTEEEREYQLKKRGRYVEFNLLYDRGTKFGLMTGGNTEAILMSLPPIVKW